MDLRACPLHHERHQRWTHLWLCGMVAGAMACGSGGDPITPGPQLSCVQLTGEGTTEGDRNQLAGNGIFYFDEVERPGQVGLYLFDITPAANDGLNVDTKYQFHWDNGDSFLSQDQAYFEPTFEENTYRFNVQLSVVAGSGVFVNLVGERPFTLSAEMTFGPPAVPGGVMSAAEAFEFTGTFCH